MLFWVMGLMQVLKHKPDIFFAQKMLTGGESGGLRTIFSPAQARKNQGQARCQ
jgi:hypothetical protein